MTSFLLLVVLYADVYVNLERPEPMPLGNLQGIVSERGDFLVGDGQRVFHWSPDGKLVRVIYMPPFFIHSFYYDHSRYWLCCFVAGEEPGSMVEGSFFVVFLGDGQPYEAGRVLSGLIPNFNIPYFNSVDGKIFIPYALHHTDPRETSYMVDGPYLNLAREVNYEESGGRSQIRPMGVGFCKINDRLLDMDFQYMRVWIIAKNGVYMVMNELQPYIYLHDSVARRREREGGGGQPTRVPRIHLLLQKYVPAPSRTWSPGRTMRVEEAQLLMAEWKLGINWIRFFGSLHRGNGYVVAYSLATEEPKVPRLGIQFFSSVYSPIGPLIETTGLILGCNNGQTFVFNNTEQGLSVMVFQP